MAALLVCAAEPVLGFFKAQQYLEVETYNPIRATKQLKAAAIVVVQKDSSAWDRLNEFEDGLHFVEQQRLRDCELPFIIIDTSIGKQEDQEERLRVYEDPYVRRISLEEVLNLQSLKDLTAYFGPPLSNEEKEMLFKDLRQTLYRHEGYINALRHRAMRAMDQIKQKSTFREEVHDLMQQAYQLLKVWCPKCDLSHRHRQLFETLASGSSDSTTHQALSDWFEGLAKLVKQSRDKETEQAIPLPDLKVLYVSDSAENRQMLKDCFEQTYDYYPIKCRCVATPEEAIEAAARCGEQWCTIVTDFRFYDTEEKRIAPRNGYHILDKLQKTHPFWQYLMLTNFPVKEYDTLPIPKKVEVFVKNQVLRPESSAFNHFARRIVSFHERAAAQQGDWPVVLQSKDDEKWRKYYRIFTKGADFKASEDEISQQACQAIKALINGKPYEIPAHGTRFSVVINKIRLKEPNHIEQEEEILKVLKDMLLVRRIYLGLFQLNLADLFPEIRRHLFNANLSFKCRVMASANALMKRAELARLDQPKSTEVSNYFTTLRLLAKVDYRFSDEYRASHLTLAETNWLAKQNDFLNHLNCPR